MSAEDTLRLLAEGDLEPLGFLPGASNATYLAEVRRGDERVRTVYKPRDGETTLWDYPEGTLHRREVAASVFADALGWPPVPPTVLRDGPMGPGALQLFIEAVPGEHFFTLRETRSDDLRRFAAFDVVINNGDRKGGHCLLDADGTIWGVDHGVSFGVEPNLRTVIWDYAGEPVPPPILADLQRVAAELRAGDLGSHLRELLAQDEVTAIGVRAERLVAEGVLPRPGSRRHFPWPLV